MLPCLILAAGLGTRLDPITRLVAKPAVPLGDRSLIEHTLAWLTSHGVTDVVVNLHHRPASLTSRLGDGRHLGARVRYSWEVPILGSAGGPRHALPLLDADTFLIVNGDTLCRFDLARLFHAHATSGAEVTMAVVRNPAPDRYNGFRAGDDGCVTAWVPRGEAAGTWHFVGVQVANRSVFAGLADGVPAETVSGVYRALISHAPGRVRVYPIDQAVIDVGTPRDYLHAATTWFPSATRATGSIVWHTAHVAPGADLDRCIVIGDVSVPAGFHARNAIVAPASILQPDDLAEQRAGVAVFAIDAGQRAGGGGER